MKFDAFDSKVTGTIAYFNINKSNLAINDARLIVDYAAGLVDDTVTFTPEASEGASEGVKPYFLIIFPTTSARPGADLTGTPCNSG